MADEGYLIGYEDASGNFVRIGQINNAADDVTKPLVLRHTNSNEKIELDGSSLRTSVQIGDSSNRQDVFADTVDLNSLNGAGLDTKADLTQSGGVLVSSQLPDLAITNIDVVADKSARLALNAEEGDVAIQTDINQTFILSTNNPSVDSDWIQIDIDVTGAIDGQQITPSGVGTSSARTDVVADNVDANSLTGSASAVRTRTRAFLSSPSSASPVPFDSVSFDPDGNFDTSANEYIVPEDGIYLLSANIRLANSVSAGTLCDFGIQVNGRNQAFGELDATGDRPTVSITDVTVLDQGDTITVRNFGSVTLKDPDPSTFFLVIGL